MQDDNENRLSSISSAPQDRNAGANVKYTRFIKAMRILLPAAALIIITLIFIWPQMKDTIEPIAQSAVLPDVKDGQNQLIKARYESLDSDQQPFTITSDKAIQDPNNPMLVNLENPTADILLKDGAWIAAQSDDAIYEQQSEKLTLKGNVRLFHDAGYSLKSEEMLVNIKTQSALSNMDVIAQGPEGVINAVGLEASGTDNVIIFTGPAKMTLNTTDNILEQKEAAPQ